MSFLSFYVFALLSAVTAVYALRAAYHEASNRILARRAGCQPPVTRPSRLPLGLDNLARTIRAMLNKTLQNDDHIVHEEMGRPATWRQNILGTYYTSTADPDNIKAMLATQFDDFELGTLRIDQLGPLTGPGIFTSDGKEWQHQRAMLRPQFTRTQIANLALLETHVQNLFAHFDGAQPGAWTAEVDLVPLLFNLTLDSATEFLFGQSVQSQLSYKRPARDSDAGGQVEKEAVGGKDWSSFGRAWDRVNATIALRGMLMDFYFLYNPKSFVRDCQQVHRFADFFVERALHPEPTDASQPAPYVFLHELAKTTRDPAVLRSQLLNLLLAGRDTTAGLLGWTFFVLARHPTHYAHLHRVVLAAFGPYSDTSAITFTTLKDCRPVQNLLSEVLRLYPVVPENVRRAVRHTTLPRGGGPDGTAPVFVRRGEYVLYNTNVMHRRKELWGDDAHEFVPARWEGRRHGWEFLPFNGGPRICLGQQYALTEAAYVLVRTLQRYSAMENMDTDKVTRHQYSMTTAPVKVPVRFYQVS